MTVQQQVAKRVMNLSDEGARLVGQLLNGLNPLLFMENGKTQEAVKAVDVSRRFGTGKGIIRNPLIMTANQPHGTITIPLIVSFWHRQKQKI